MLVDLKASLSEDFFFTLTLTFWGNEVVQVDSLTQVD